MFNSYCGSLDGFFGQMVYYGVIKEEDAQCFSVQGSIEPGSFTLVAAAVFLALLNSFVTKATRQYFFEMKNNDNNYEDCYGVVDSSSSSSSSSNNTRSHGEEDNKVEEEHIDGADPENDSPPPQITIRPIAVMFTDTYRWLLRGSNNNNNNKNNKDVGDDIESFSDCKKGAKTTAKGAEVHGSSLSSSSPSSSSQGGGTGNGFSDTEVAVLSKTPL